MAQESNAAATAFALASFFGQDKSFNKDASYPCSFKYLSATAPLNEQEPYPSNVAGPAEEDNIAFVVVVALRRLVTTFLEEEDLLNCDDFKKVDC